MQPITTTHSLTHLAPPWPYHQPYHPSTLYHSPTPLSPAWPVYLPASKYTATTSQPALHIIVSLPCSGTCRGIMIENRNRNQQSVKEQRPRRHQTQARVPRRDLRTSLIPIRTPQRERRRVSQQTRTHTHGRPRARANHRLIPPPPVAGRR